MISSECGTIIQYSSHGLTKCTVITIKFLQVLWDEMALLCVDVEGVVCREVEVARVDLMYMWKARLKQRFLLDMDEVRMAAC